MAKHVVESKFVAIADCVAVRTMPLGFGGGGCPRGPVAAKVVVPGHGEQVPAVMSVTPSSFHLGYKCIVRLQHTSVEQILERLEHLPQSPAGTCPTQSAQRRCPAVVGSFVALQQRTAQVGQVCVTVDGHDGLPHHFIEQDHVVVDVNDRGEARRCMYSPR